MKVATVVGTRSPKLLFLACYFPPARTIGCVRAWNMAKYLARWGWEVTVVTPHPSIWRYAGELEETASTLAEKGIQRISTDHRWCCLAPDLLGCWNRGLGWFAGGVCRKTARRFGIDSGIGWIKPAEQACAALTAQDVDVILATASPFAAFKLARRLSDRLGRPYVLDYRDPWTGNPHASRPFPPAVIEEETRLLAGCAAVTIVSPSWSMAMDRRFGLGSKLHVVTNGYDPEELAEVEPYDFGHFAIVYAGTFYPPKRVISPVMAALKRLKETVNGNGGQWYFHYYGEQTPHVCEEAKRFGVMDRVILHGQVSRAEALSAVRGAGVAVVITSVAEEAMPADQGMVTGKVFEALGLGTPILLVAPHGSDVETIIDTAGLACRFTGSDTDGIASFLADAMRGLAPAPKERKAYAWTNIVKNMDTVLRAAMREERFVAATVRTRF